MKSWSNSTRAGHAAIPDSRRPDIRIGRAPDDDGADPDPEPVPALPFLDWAIDWVIMQVQSLRSSPAPFLMKTSFSSAFRSSSSLRSLNADRVAQPELVQNLLKLGLHVPCKP